MRRASFSPLVFALTFALPLAAQAQSTTPAATPSAAPPSAGAPVSIRRDPKGLTGVGPQWEAFGKGDTALLAKDYDGAIQAYREAIAKFPENPLAHYRLAEAEKLKGDLKTAEATYQSALRLADRDAALKAGILFCLADLAERQKAYDQALERWKTYEQFIAQNPGKPVGYLATVAERRKRLEEWSRNSQDSADVKARIAKRLQKAEEASQKNAGKK